MNYLKPLFRGLHQTIMSASNAKDSNVVRAKNRIGYSHEQLIQLKMGAQPKASKREINLAYDTYYDWIVSQDEKTVKALTNKPKKFWTDFERRLEKTINETKGINIERINHALVKAISEMTEKELHEAKWPKKPTKTMESTIKQ